MKTRTIPSANYPIGSTTVDIPPSAQKKFIGLTLSLSRESWPAGQDFVLSDGHVQHNVALVVSFEKTLNDVDWLKVASFTFDGGPQLERDGLTPAPFSVAQLSFLDGQGQPIAEDGDLRVTFQRLVALRTAVTVQMREIGD